MVSTRQSSNMGSSASGGPVNEIGEVNSLRKHQPVTTAGASSSGVTAETPPFRNLNLLDLPVEILEKIFGYLGFNTVAHLRHVSTKSQCKYKNIQIN